MTRSTRPVVVGSGLAGLVTAWSLAPRPCLLVSAGALGEGTASQWAQGGLAAALAPTDSPTRHAMDTLAAGAHLSDPDAVARVTGAASDAVELLCRLGVAFDRDPDGSPSLALEGGHGNRRIVHAGDRTGAALVRALTTAVRGLPSVELLEHTRVTGLLLDDHGAISGVRLSGAGGTWQVPTRQVVLATGGSAAIYRHTTNPLASHGHGLALAARAGAVLADLEFVQFHPTALDVGRDPMPLVTEAVRGAGARLLADGERFVDELAPRDVVASAVWSQLDAGRGVGLDARHVAGLTTHFPGLVESCAVVGLDPRRDVLPVRPAAHYHMGGVLTGDRGRTTVPGLWAAGEVACTGLHGANRLASNSLLEAVVTGREVAGDLTACETRAQQPWCPVERTSHLPTLLGPDPTAEREPLPLNEIRSLMSSHVGVTRDETGLAWAQQVLEPHLGEDHALVAWMVAGAARRRRESCGGHLRTDGDRRLEDARLGQGATA